VADRTALSASEMPHGASLQWIVDGMPLSRHPLTLDPVAGAKSA
jgi:hypothetical protein